MLGWHSPERGVLEPSPVAVFSMSGEQALYVTMIDLVEDSRADAACRSQSSVRNTFPVALVGSSERNSMKLGIL